MAVPRILPEIGTVVEVIQGRDRGLFAVVIGHSERRFVIIADGHTRRADKPKKKNVMHVRSTSYLAHEVVEALRADGKITNARLRHALRLYQELRGGTSEGIEEGGVLNGEG